MDFAMANSGEFEDSVVYRLDPRAKLVALFVFAGTVVSTPPRQLAAFVAYGGILLWVAALGRVPVIKGVLRAACVLPFSILAACWLPFHAGGGKVEVMGLFSVSVDGVWLLSSVMMKSFLGAAAALLLIATTSFGHLLQGLRGLAVPGIFVDLLGVSYRYIFVLVEEARRLRQAAALRGYHPRWLPQAAVIGQMLGRLFLRSYDRAERVFDAMVLRGYTGVMPVSRPLRFRVGDALTVVGMAGVLVSVRLLF